MCEARESAGLDTGQADVIRWRTSRCGVGKLAPSRPPGRAPLWWRAGRAVIQAAGLRPEGPDTKGAGALWWRSGPGGVGGMES